MAWLKCKAPIVLPHWEEEITYSGNVVSVVIPYTALYKLEVWGSKGGDTNVSGGYGGYAVGYKLLNKNDILYVCCGGIPYNGGGNATDYYRGDGSYGSNYGGGATHITKTYNTVLTSIGKTNFDAAGLIVAGGGGGAASNWNGSSDINRAGGGGGTNGDNGYSPNSGINYSYPGLGGTQTGPGAAKYTTKAQGAFGRGGNAVTDEGTGFRRTAAGGGGGYYGGGGGYARDYPSQGPGGGGSGWIGGVPEITYKGITYTPSMTNSVNTTTGKAKISLEKF